MKNNQSVFIIAEAGVNHNGSLELAKQLIDKALDAKADAVKFQTFIAENVISKYAEKATYQKLSTGGEESQLEMVKKLQLSFDDFAELQTYSKAKNILFLSTPFDMQSISFLETLKMGIWKIPSGEITNFPYLNKIGAYKEKVIISSGMCTLSDIENALSVLINAGTKREDITVLHCNTEYPTPFTDVNLKAMLTIRDAFGVSVGYSDHTLGIEVPIAAVAMGAAVIEKHFTLDKNMPGPDHKASLDPMELNEMVRSIRNIEKAMSGSGIKLPSSSEIKNMNIARKSIHLTMDLTADTIILEEHIIALRPGDGISAMQWENVIGKKLRSDKKEFDKIKWEDLQ